MDFGNFWVELKKTIITLLFLVRFDLIRREAELLFLQNQNPVCSRLAPA